MTEETRGKLSRFWKATKDWAYKYIGGLFMIEKDGGKKVVSVSRVLLIATMGWLFYFWSDWTAAMTLTPEAIALAINAQLPEGKEIAGVDLLAASQKIIDNLPKTEPPMLKTVFLTLCGYAFGDKIVGIARKKLNGD